VKTKFHGNSIEIFAVGDTHVYINKTGEHYSWRQPNSYVHNLFVGGMWLEHWGEIEITSDMHADKCYLKYHKSGWFGEKYLVSGHIQDASGKIRMQLSGKWNSHLSAKYVDGNLKSDEEFFLWQRNHPESENRWKLPDFCLKELLAMNPEYESLLPPTDSRLRTDRRALEEGDLSLAAKEKSRIEEGERHEARNREKSSEPWAPKYFRQEPGGSQPWVYIGNYWEQREELRKQL